MLDKRTGNQNIARAKSQLSTAEVAQRQSARGAAIGQGVQNAVTAGPRAALSAANTMFPQAKPIVQGVAGAMAAPVRRLSADNARNQFAAVSVPKQQPLATQQFPSNLKAATGAVNTAANASNRAALGKQFPNGRQVDANSPMSRFPNPADQPQAETQKQRPTAGPGQHSTAVFSQQPGNNNQILRHPDQINNNPTAAAPGRLAPQNPQMNGTMRAGQGSTMDVSFAQDTPLAARQAFMADPLKPTAQMAMYDRRAQAASDQEAFTQKMRLAGAASGGQQQQQKQPELLTPENSRGMGWKSRLAANNQAQENWRQEQQNSTQLATQGLQNSGQLQNTQLSGTISGQNQLATQGLQNSGQIENTRLSGTIAGQNQLNNTALGTQGRLAEIDRTGVIDTQQIQQQGDIAAQESTRKFGQEAILKGADPVAVQRGVMNTQGGATPDVTGVVVPQATEAESYTYHAPQLDTSGAPIPGTGGFAAKREPRLIPLDAAAPGQPMPQEIPAAQPGGVVATPEEALGNDPVKVQQFNGHLQKLRSLQSPEEAQAYFDSLLQPDQYGVVDTAMYSLLMREIAGGQ